MVTLLQMWIKKLKEKEIILVNCILRRIQMLIFFLIIILKKFESGNWKISYKIVF